MLNLYLCPRKRKINKQTNNIYIYIYTQFILFTFSVYTLSEYTQKNRRFCMRANLSIMVEEYSLACAEIVRESNRTVTKLSGSVASWYLAKESFSLYTKFFNVSQVVLDIYTAACARTRILLGCRIATYAGYPRYLPSLWS